MRPGKAVGVVVSLLALSATTACTGTVKGSEVEQQVVSTAKKQNIEATSVSCPDLKAQKGQKVTCSLSVQGRKLRLVAEVRSVDGKRVSYFLNAPTAAG